MARIDCRGGQTQIAKVLAHARRENDRFKVGALVFIGDAMEENLDELCSGAGELGLRALPDGGLAVRVGLPAAPRPAMA